MRVLAACSLGGAGHLQPLLPLLAAARRRGDETLVIAPPSMRDMVEAAGFEYAIGGEPPEHEVGPIRERLPVAPPAEASVLGNRDLFGRLATTAMLPPMERAITEWMPDIVLRDPCEYASAVVAHARRIPTAQVAISLAEAEAGSIDVAAPALEAHRAGLADELRSSLYLTRFPESLDPSPFPSTLRFREPAAVARPGSRTAWLDGSGAPLVYVTFGTVLGHMTIAADIYRVALGALEHVDARVLLTVGRTFDRTQLGEIPDHVHVEAWVDQADVLKVADLVVCHGGSGTVFGALAAGVPVVVVPVFADQFENGRRVSASGAGLIVEAAPETRDRPRTLFTDAAAPRITAAINEALGDERYRRNAEGVAAEMAATPSVDDVLAGLLAGDANPATER